MKSENPLDDLNLITTSTVFVLFILYILFKESWTEISYIFDFVMDFPEGQWKKSLYIILGIGIISVLSIILLRILIIYNAIRKWDWKSNNE